MATVMTSAEFVKRLKAAATDYKTLYVMGCFGAPMNSANKKRYTANHSYNKQAARTAMINAATADDAPLAKFDPLVWQAVINYATVNRDCTITFTFRDGTEKTVPIKNGVRPYTKRNKPQEVDGNDG